MKNDWKTYLHTIREKEIKLTFNYLGNRNFSTGLEIGAGDGFQTTLLAPYFKNFISSDLNFERIGDENKLSSVRYLKCDADNDMSKTFHNEELDFVFSSNVLEHLADPDKFLSENFRVLKGGGYAVHVVPNRWIKATYLLGFYPNVLKMMGNRLVGLFAGKPVFRGKDIMCENNINKKTPGTISRFKKIFLPQMHGNYSSHFEEWKSWGKKDWEDKFSKAGFVIEKVIKGPAFSGYGFDIKFARKIFERFGVSSEYIYIMSKPVDIKEILANKKTFKVAYITAVSGSGYLANTVLDGLQVLKNKGFDVIIALPNYYPVPFVGDFLRLDNETLIDFAKEADIIFSAHVDGGETNVDLIKKIDSYEKMIVVDGSEPKGNNRLDYNIQRDILKLTYTKYGSINKELLEKCPIYLRREKPYIKGITHFPYGIETRYVSYSKDRQVKDIDFVCVFGQEISSPMRKHCREMLEEFCVENNFKCFTSKTKDFSFDANKTAGRGEFYEKLARAKVGVSVSGGGYDTARFWETLGNNCLLLTETIDIGYPDDKKLKYDHIYEFHDLFDFRYQLEKLGNILKKEYNVESLSCEYDQIMKENSTLSRVLDVFKLAQAKGLINKDLLDKLLTISK